MTDRVRPAEVRDQEQIEQLKERIHSIQGTLVCNDDKTLTWRTESTASIPRKRKRKFVHYSYGKYVEGTSISFLICKFQTRNFYFFIENLVKQLTTSVLRKYAPYVGLITKEKSLDAYFMKVEEVNLYTNLILA